MHKIFVLQYVYFMPLHVREHVPIIRRSKLHYTASGIITSIGGRLVHRLREDWFNQSSLNLCTRRIVKQKFCASSWLITEINILRCTVSKTSKFGVLVNIIFSNFHRQIEKFKIHLSITCRIYIHRKNYTPPIVGPEQIRRGCKKKTQV